MRLRHVYGALAAAGATLSPPSRGEGTERRQNHNRRHRQDTIALSPREAGRGTG